MKIKTVILSAAKNLSRMRVLNSDIRQRFLVVLLLGMTMMVSPVLAVDSTPSADIKAKLEELKKAIASKAAILKLQVDKKLKDKAYIGKLKTKSDNALTIATKNGPRIVNVNQDTIFESQVKGKKITQKTLTEEDYLASLGDVDETEVLTAKKIILLPVTETQNPKVYLWGQVSAVSDKLITIKDKSQKNIAVSDSSNSKVSIGDFVILTGIHNKNDIFEAEFVYNSKTATKSATPKR